MRCRELIRVLAWIIGGLFREGLAKAWRRLGLCLALACLALGANLWRAGETNSLSQSAVHSVQIGHAVSKAQEKPLVSFI